jgi:hypothetical protein
MQETIGQSAGQVWYLLANATEPVKITDIPKKTKLTAQLAYMGLGWLAREGKLIYHNSGASTSVSLNNGGCGFC